MNPTLVALALALPLAAAAQPGGDPQRGLVASFRLDGDVVDDVSGLRATPVATRPVDDRHGARGAALWFDGARSAVNLGNALQPARFTISAWVRPEVVDRVQVILSKIHNLPGHWQKNLELRLEAGGRLFLHVPSGRAWEGVQGTRPLVPGQWTHVAATYDGARAQLYVDGAPDGGPLVVRYAQSQTDTWIGARPEQGGRDGRTPSGPTFFFFGALDDVRVWERPLSPAEVSFVSDRAPPPPAPPPPPPGPPPPGMRAAPVAIYPLDGDALDALGGAPGKLAGTRPAEDRAGRPRSALAFAGKDHVDLGVRAEPERLSLAVWVRPNRGDREQVIFSKLSTAPSARQKWLELRVEPFGRVAFTVPTASPFNHTVQTQARLASGRWTHLAATFDGARAVLYVDGVPAGEARVDPFDGSRGPVFVGARPDAQGRRARFARLFEGRLDDVRVYRGALSPDEVAFIARGGDEGPRPRPPGGGDDDEPEHVLVKVDRLLARYDAACLRGDPERLGRTEERIARELEEEARAARGDRELAERLRQAAREVERGRGRFDPMSLDHKRSLLASLSDALWNDLARDFDDAPRPFVQDPRGPGGPRETW
jgi:hypothetical protein